MQRREASAELSCVPKTDSGEAVKPEKRTRANKYIGMRQACNIMEAVAFAKSIGLPLVAHLTVHWSLTDIGDDPDGWTDRASCSRLRGRVNVNAEGSPMSSTVICYSICR